MNPEKKLEDLVAIHDSLKKHAPSAVLLDLVERPRECITLYRDDTKYFISHLDDSGVYFGRCYDSSYEAWLDFDKVKHYEYLNH